MSEQQQQDQRHRFPDSSHPMLFEVYRESGEQVRNLNTMRNIFLSFYAVALAAFFAILAQSPEVAAGEEGFSRSIWALPAFLSLAGGLNVAVTWQFVQRALARQRDIVLGVLSEEDRQALGFTPSDSRPLEERLLDYQWWWDRRLDWFSLLVYVSALAFTAYWSLAGDPFGFAA